MSELSDEQVDAELSTAIYGYDPRDKYPEWSHAQMRDAYRAGREDALAEHRELLTVRSVEELDALPPLTVILDADGVVVRRDPWGEFHDSPRWHPLDGSDHQARDFGLDADEVRLPALLLFSPDWGTP